MQNSVGNIFDYLAWRGDLSFEQSGFNAVDGIILAVFSYFKFEYCRDFRGKTLQYAVNAMKDVPVREKMMIVYLVQETSSKLIEATIQSKRFKDIRILDYIEEHHEETLKQFAAVTFELPDGSVYISYRGTDDSVVGWKEDLRMALISGIPSQLSAAKYAQDIFEKYRRPIRMGGHSKGGNLAIWAGAHLSDEGKEALLQVFNYDGPGFLDDFLESECYRSIIDKIYSYIPESSIVGIMMGNCGYFIINSSSHMLFQHDPLTWCVIGKHFDYVTERTAYGNRMEERINGIIRDMSKEQIAELVDKISDAIDDSNVKTLDELKFHKFRLIRTVLRLIEEAENVKHMRPGEKMITDPKKYYFKEH